MGSIGKCNICNEEILYKPDEVAALGKHHIYKHKNTEVSYIALNTADKVIGGGADPNCNCNCDCGCQCTRAKAKRVKNRLFKTTVESWRKGPHPVTCPSCGQTDVPLVKTQRNKLSKSSTSAFLMLGCWPICFLPFILGGSDIMNYYCKFCGTLLVINNRKDGKPVPVPCVLPTEEGKAQACTCRLQVLNMQRKVK